jgi:hypothetical protein
VTAPELPAVADLDDAALEAEVALLEDREVDIRRQLEDDRGEGVTDQQWRFRARTARRYALARLDALRREQDRRHAAARRAQQAARPPSSEAAIAHAERQAGLQAERARIEALKAERMAAHAEREKTRAEFFVAAATQLLDQDTRVAIWDRAQALFPDAPVWGLYAPVAATAAEAPEAPKPAERKTLRSLAELRTLL